MVRTARDGLVRRPRRGQTGDWPAKTIARGAKKIWLKCPIWACGRKLFSHSRLDSPLSRRRVLGRGIEPAGAGRRKGWKGRGCACGATRYWPVKLDGTGERWIIARKPGAERPFRFRVARMRSSAPSHVSAETLLQLLTWVGVLIGLILVAVLIVQRFRGYRAQTGLGPEQLLANFEEMRTRGDISDADYRKIKSVLGARLQPNSSEGPRPG